MMAVWRSVRLCGLPGQRDLETKSVPSGTGTASKCDRTGAADAGRARRLWGCGKEVNLDFVPDAKIGDYVLVHVGFALTVIDENEALQVFEALREMEELLDSEMGGLQEGLA
jgi:hydrogenase assembly chaperone HypC/HupF